MENLLQPTFGSQIDYCQYISANAKGKYLDRLQLMQNKAAALTEPVKRDAVQSGLAIVTRSTFSFAVIFHLENITTQKFPGFYLVNLKLTESHMAIRPDVHQKDAFQFPRQIQIFSKTLLCRER